MEINEGCIFLQVTFYGHSVDDLKLVSSVN